MINELGGKETAKAMITLAIKLNARANEKLLLDFTGLPPSMLQHLLNELESEQVIYHQELGTLKLWRMCAAESNEEEEMNKTKVVGYALIVIPIVAGIVAGVMFLRTDLLEATAIAASLIIPIAVGCHLLAKS